MYIAIDSWKLRLTKGFFYPLVYHFCSLNEHIFYKYLFKFLFISPLTSKLKVLHCSNLFMYFGLLKVWNSLPFEEKLQFCPTISFHSNSFYISSMKNQQIVVSTVEHIFSVMSNMKNLNLCLPNFSNFIALNFVCKCLYCTVKISTKRWFY